MISLAKLQRGYDRLGVWERVPLLLAARGRGDVAEGNRLKQAAPRIGWHFPQHAVAEHSLHLLAMEYLQQQTETAGSFYFSMWLWSNADEELTDEAADARDYAIESLHHFIAANARGWEQFCRVLGVDPGASVKANHFAKGQSPWFTTLLTTAPDEEQFLTRAASRGDDPASLTTAARTAFWRGQLRKMTRGCPVPEVLLRNTNEEVR